MQAPPATNRTYCRRALATALAFTLPWIGATTAGAAGSDGAASPSLQARAAALTAEIQDQGTHLDQLAEGYDAAVLRRAAAERQLRTVGRLLAGTTAEVDRWRAVLQGQAVAAYVSDGTPLDVVVSGHAGLDPSLTNAYAAILGGSDQHSLRGYEAAHRAQLAQQERLREEEESAAAALRTLDGARRQAEAAQLADQRLLGGLRGRLAVLVADDQRRQQAAEARAERAVLGTEAPTTSRPVATAPAVGAPAPVTSPTTARRRAPSPPTTARRRVSPPTTTRRRVTTTTTMAPTTTTPPTTAPTHGISPVLPGAAAAVAYARMQLGKPYRWGGAGPEYFDCSGLTMMSWEAGGVYFPHLAQAQYDLTERLPLADLEPGDLVFFGTPSDVYHVGIYIGGGQMIDAPETGQDVSIQSIYWPTLLGGGRVTG